MIIFMRIICKKIIIFFLILMFSTLIYNTSYAFSPSSSNIYQGIDVSRWQGNINFSLVKYSRINIVYIKSSEGQSYIDPYFEKNYSEAKANGLKVGFYHYVTARSVRNSQRTSNIFC